MPWWSRSAAYGYLKLFGKRYILTNRGLQVRQMIGLRTFADVPLADIKQLVIEELPGQAFHKAADIVAKGADGKTILRLEGVQRPVGLPADDPRGPRRPRASRRIAQDDPVPQASITRLVIEHKQAQGRLSLAHSFANDDSLVAYCSIPRR